VVYKCTRTKRIKGGVRIEFDCEKYLGKNIEIAVKEIK